VQRKERSGSREMESFDKTILHTKEDISYSNGCEDTARKLLQVFADAFPKEKGISSSHVKIHRFIDELKNKIGLD
jgi:hypothetical protein